MKLRREHLRIAYVFKTEQKTIKPIKNNSFDQTDIKSNYSKIGGSLEGAKTDKK